MDLKSATTIGRPIDPAYPTNRAVAILTLLVAVAGTAWQVVSGQALLPAALWGLQAGLALFLTWALGRELDPDHDLSAFVGAALALIGVVVWGLPGLLLLFWTLLAARVVNRTTGLPAGVVDSLGLLALAGWLTWQGNWLVGLLSALALLLDGLLPAPNPVQRVYAAVAALATVILAVVRGGLTPGGLPSTPYLLAALVVAALFLLVIATSGSVAAMGDRSGERLNARRVRAGQAILLLAALGTALWQGDAGMIAMLGLWAAMLGAGVYRLGLLARGARRPAGA